MLKTSHFWSPKRLQNVIQMEPKSVKNRPRKKQQKKLHKSSKLLPFWSPWTLKNKGFVYTKRLFLIFDPSCKKLPPEPQKSQKMEPKLLQNEAKIYQKTTSKIDQKKGTEITQKYLPNGAILAPKIHLDGVLEATLGTSWAMLAPRFTQDPPRTPPDHQNGAKMLPKLIKN